MDESAILDTVRAKYDLLRPLMDERMRRQWAASEASILKRGGVTTLSPDAAVYDRNVEREREMQREVAFGLLRF